MQQEEVKENWDIATTYNTCDYGAKLSSSLGQCGKIVAVVPQTIRLFNSVCIAVNRYCRVECGLFRDGTPKHELEHRFERLPSTDTRAHDWTKVRWMLDKMHLQQVYEFGIEDPFDVSGEFAVISVLVAVWKALTVFRKDLDRKDLISRLVHQVLLSRHGGLGPVVSAMIDGSQAFFHPARTPDIPMDSWLIPSTFFNENYELVFFRTSFHRNESKTTPDMEFCENVRLIFSYNELDSGQNTFSESLERNPIGTHMKCYSKARVRGQASEAEKRSLSAFKAVEQEHPDLLLGYEVLEGGNLLLLQKGQFSRDENVLQKILTAFVVKFNRPMNLTFELLDSTKGAMILTRTDASEIASARSVEVCITESQQPSVELLQEMTFERESTAESSGTASSRMVHEDTHDDDSDVHMY
ncbi:unnamed protein product [Caenorhabditis sp. 36 PRJEB53466]|nr:unnamed protein product [Caenorhabditis sp. 36 PRJEB53466]